MKIDWENITIQEAQDFADELCSSFSLTVKCFNSNWMSDVCFLIVECVYDDNFHAKKIKSIIESNEDIEKVELPEIPNEEK